MGSNPIQGIDFQETILLSYIPIDYQVKSDERIMGTVTGQVIVSRENPSQCSTPSANVYQGSSVAA